MAVDSIKGTLDAQGHIQNEELRRRLRDGEPLYSNIDASVYLRSCEEEIPKPLHGTTTGEIPIWLKGSFLRNGPGRTKFGNTMYNHLFDGSALLHRFAVDNGEVTYQCQFLKTNTYLKNQAANRIVVNELGTKAVPDPCQTIFQRVTSLFSTGEMTDNANISIYPFGDEFYCFTESPIITRMDPTTLDTLEKVDVSKHVTVVTHTSHPHVDSDGSVYNQAMSIQGRYPHYSIVKFPIEGAKQTKGMFEEAEITASVCARWPLHPSYMHSFGLTDLYFVIIEQPMTISLPTMFMGKFLGNAMSSCFKYYEGEPTLFHVVERNTGKVHRTYSSDGFFYFHTVNQYEKDGHLVIDLCCYSDAKMLDCLYFDALKNLEKNPDYARLFRGRPLRFVLPLHPDETSPDINLITLTGSSAAAYWRKSEVHAKPELLCDLGCELPRFNSAYLGKPYRYFYAISSDVDLQNPGTLIKVDTRNKTTKTWNEPGAHPGEPVFVPSPDSKSEDDGVVLSALVWGEGCENQVGMLVLDAKTFQELGRTVFLTPSPVPRALHGWFTPNI